MDEQASRDAPSANPVLRRNHSIAEVTIGMICACLPSLHLVVMRLRGVARPSMQLFATPSPRRVPRKPNATADSILWRDTTEEPWASASTATLTATKASSRGHRRGSSPRSIAETPKTGRSLRAEKTPPLPPPPLPPAAPAGSGTRVEGTKADDEASPRFPWAWAATTGAAELEGTSGGGSSSPTRLPPAALGFAALRQGQGQKKPPPPPIRLFSVFDDPVPVVLNLSPLLQRSRARSPLTLLPSSKGRYGPRLGPDDQPATGKVDVGGGRREPGGGDVGRDRGRGRGTALEGSFLEVPRVSMHTNRAGLDCMVHSA